jgi:hypothetical protein
MRRQLSAREVYGWLESDLKRRPDIGIRKMIADLAFEPPNPFDPAASRKPRAQTVLAVVLVVAALGLFAYFNASF